MKLENRQVVVTGASRGIGAAIARALRSEGARVVGTHSGRSVSLPPDTCDEWLVADFTELEQVKACAEAVRRMEPDVLINNAGINKIAPFLQVDTEDFLRIHRVNVLAPLLLCQAVIPAMKARGWGRIVNVSSVLGKVGKAQRAAYSASKFALDGLTVALAAEHACDGILANSVAPGFIDTDLTRRVLGAAGIAAVVASVPIGRLGSAQEIARLVTFLAGPDNSLISGQNIAIDGGFTRV
jgi:NAD(P)-dependent dehydrogenase (short-subunit alcohol dehydrogenase family)